MPPRLLPFSREQGYKPFSKTVSLSKDNIFADSYYAEEWPAVYPHKFYVYPLTLFASPPPTAGSRIPQAESPCKIGSALLLTNYIHYNDVIMNGQNLTIKLRSSRIKTNYTIIKPSKRSLSLRGYLVYLAVDKFI